MGNPYVGEIRMFAGNFAPAGWAFCNGALQSIAENEILFQLIGTTYGGDGQNTFALPDLRGRLPIHQGSGFSLAQTGGAETVTLNVQQLPTHTHHLVASPSGASSNVPTNNLTGTTSGIQIYRSATPASPMSALAVGQTGNSQPHDNFQPYLCINFILSLFGIFPSQT
jgi:microcystin-dependent protein